MRIYLAGPMRNYPLWNFPAFEEGAKVLRAMGHDVISPAEHDIACGFDPCSETLDGFDLKAAFRWDLEQVMAADAVVCLPGWEKSKGATAEASVAVAIGTPVYELGELLAVAEGVTS